MLGSSLAHEYFREKDLKQVAQFHARLPLIAAVCAAAILAACGGGSGDDKLDASLAAAPAEPAPEVPAEEEIAQAPSENEALPAATTCGLANFQSEVLRLANEMRSEARYCGSTLYQAARALEWDGKLFAAAAGHSADMATNNYFSHTSLDGRTASQRVTEAGYAWQTTGENIAAGQRTIADVMQGWGDSPGHCANIMNPGFIDVAVSCAASTTSTYRQYWTMSLGAPR